jgi:hypothetical protein
MPRQPPKNIYRNHAQFVHWSYLWKQLYLFLLSNMANKQRASTRKKTSARTVGTRKSKKVIETRNTSSPEPAHKKSPSRPRPQPKRRGVTQQSEPNAVQDGTTVAEDLAGAETLVLMGRPPANRVRVVPTPSRASSISSSSPSEDSEDGGPQELEPGKPSRLFCFHSP